MLRRHMRGGSLDRRCGCQVWRFAPHRLPGSGCIPARWPDRPASQAPWPKRRAQAVRRGHRVRANLASCRARLDDRRLCPSRSGKVRYHGSPPQSGAGVGEQKKTAQSGISITHSGGDCRSLRRTSPTSSPTGRTRRTPGRPRCSHALWLGVVGPEQAHGYAGTSARIAFAIWDRCVSPRLVWSRTRPPGSRSDSQHSTGGFSACLN